MAQPQLCRSQFVTTFGPGCMIDLPETSVFAATLENGRYRDAESRKQLSVVPVRFVQACPRGHVADLDWKGFLHGGRTECMRQLWIEERGTSGDLSQVWVMCDCGAQRSMSEAGGHKALGFCNGRRPGVGANQHEKCDLPARLLSAPWHGMSIAACSWIPVGQIAPPPGANRSTPWGKSLQCAWGNLPHPSSRGHLIACKKMPGSATQTLS